MKKRTTPPATFRWICLGSLILTLILTSCDFSLINLPGSNTGTATPASPLGPTLTPEPAAAMNFKVTLPAPLPSGEVLTLSVVDEVTGLGLNPVNYSMQGIDALHYSVNVPLNLNSVVKYRYMRQGHLPILETTSAGASVRYRLVYVTGPSEVDDIVSAWADGAFSGPSGRIDGQVVNGADHSFLPDILVAAGGQQTLTDSNGRYSLENLPPGTHNLVVYALDGAYQTVQQGAVVAAGKTTQANLTMAPASVIRVQFTVSVPANSIPGVPVRLAGNLYPLGNTYGDLQGGLSTVASRMPLLTPLPDGRYSLTLSLPIGADFRYKYTLGDGFWNAEHNPDGSFASRHFIVPAGPNPFQVQDVVQTWQAGNSSPILFEAALPSGTPVTDIPSIQFNPYGWTEPIPMWAKGNNQWVYELYGPLNMLGEFSYRYCRNDQCGVADDVETSGGQAGRMVSASLAPQDLQDTIQNWTWFQPAIPASQLNPPVTRRSNGFWAGVEFLPMSDPTGQPWMPLAIQNVQGLGANWLVFSPSWTISRTDPFVFSPVPGSDALQVDLLDGLSRAKAVHLNTTLFPTARLPGDSAAWWKSAPRSSAWWDGWFDRYAAFAEYYADLATKAGAQALVLGGDWVSPALPNGLLADGSSSGVPANAETRWEDIFTQVRLRFSGQVLWAVSYPGGLKSVPPFAQKVDGIYLLWYAPLGGSTVNDMAASAGSLLDGDIKPIQSSLGEQLIIAVAYPSIDGAASAAEPLLTALRPANGQGKLNLQAQADLYQAMLQAITSRDWVDGFISRGFYPPVGLQDTSASVHSKPAADVLKYWFTRLLGISP